MANLLDPIFTDESKARAHFEKLLWPNGPVCPRCGGMRATLVKGKSHRKGMYQCNECRKPFTVTCGTVMEKSHIPLNKWAAAFHLMAASKKGVSAHQLHRMLKLTYKTAWFMAHRIREAMGDANPALLGADGGVVEVDETYIGKKHGTVKKAGGPSHKIAVMTLVERGGEARSFPLNVVTRQSVTEALARNVSPKAHLRTDEAAFYRHADRDFATHRSVNHSKGEYVRTERGDIGTVTTNTVEGFFSIFKRGMKGIYQHCDERHLQRYLNEFDFRYTNRIARGVDDYSRTSIAIAQTAGKRLTYRKIAMK